MSTPVVERPVPDLATPHPPPGRQAVARTGTAAVREEIASAASPPRASLSAVERARLVRPALDLLDLARRGLAEAALAGEPAERYVAAHLAALRTAAAVLAVRGRPQPRRGGPRSAWALLLQVAPELAEWAAVFSAGAPKRAAAEAGIRRVVSAREADDLVRDVSTFLALIESLLGLPHQQALPTTSVPLAG